MLLYLNGVNGLYGGVHGADGGVTDPYTSGDVDCLLTPRGPESVFGDLLCPPSSLNPDANRFISIFNWMMFLF